VTAAPTDDDREWRVSAHARAQCVERGIALAELDRLLADPPTRTQSRHAGNTEHHRRYVGYGILAIVEERSRTVITVGIHGASKADWEDAARARRSDLPEASPDVEPRRRRRADPLRTAGNADDPVPTSRVTRSNALDALHPAVRANVRAELARRGLDVRHVRILSPTRVEIVEEP